MSSKYHKLMNSEVCANRRLLLFRACIKRTTVVDFREWTDQSLLELLLEELELESESEPELELEILV